ncbi:mannose-specific lectin-like [Cheilinus undulatus]|uniref:mannose-specific lectin-like n=1 Tax=Cheilinus undulatus TaxID=241271 RepID=UPI001BD3F4D8|nr:mannose-specific lectin-like [Cheilinus undulatus]
MSRNFLSKTDELRRGDYGETNNKKWKTVIQEDGNFIIYGCTPLWTSDTYGSDAFCLCSQADCNLVMFNKSATPTWHTNTHITSESSMCRQQLTGEGRLLLWRESEELWSSANSKGTR